MLGIEIVLPELSREDVRCQMDEGGLVENGPPAANGVCTELGAEASAKGDRGVVPDGACSYWGCGMCCCWG